MKWIVYATVGLPAFNAILFAALWFKPLTGWHLTRRAREWARART